MRILLLSYVEYIRNRTDWAYYELNNRYHRFSVNEKQVVSYYLSGGIAREVITLFKGWFTELPKGKVGGEKNEKV